MEQVEIFSYLGSLISDDGSGNQEMKMIEIAKTAFDRTKNITNISMNLKTRLRVLKFVWSTMLYGCKTWTVRKNMRKNGGD